MSCLVLSVADIRKGRAICWVTSIFLTVLDNHLSVLDSIIILSKGLLQIFDVGLQNSLLLRPDHELIDFPLFIWDYLGGSRRVFSRLELFDIGRGALSMRESGLLMTAIEHVR